MNKIVLVTAFVALTSPPGRCHELTELQGKRVNALNETVEENAFLLNKYCVFGEMTVMNLDPVGPSEPLGTNSRFILFVDHTQQYRRHSCEREVINNGELDLLRWYTRIRDKKKFKGGFEFRAGDQPQEKEFLQNLMPDFDPWDASVSTNYSLSSGEVNNGFFSRVCDESKAIEYKRSRLGIQVTYQYNQMTQVVVFYSKNHGNMPSLCQWLASQQTMNPDAPANAPAILVSECRTRWTKRGESWLPTRIELDGCNSLVGQKKKLVSNIEFELNWELSDKMTKDAFDNANSSRLWSELTAAMKN